MMDIYSKRMGWGHRAKRHDYAFVELARKLYGDEAGLEAALHVACDMGLVTIRDVRIYEKVLK